MAVFAMLDIDPGTLGILIPFAAFLMTLGIVVTIAVSVAYVKVRNREVERDLLARRMAHEQRMKELEVETLRLQQGRGQALTQN